MNISRNAQIAGMPGKDARDYMRNLLRFTEGNGGLPASRLPLPKGFQTNVGVLHKFLDLGFVGFDAETKTWRVTDRGLQLAGARIGNRIPHQQATNLVMDVIDKTRLINANNDLVCHIKSVYVFGSYTEPGKLDHGDVDIAYIVTTRNTAIRAYNESTPSSQQKIIEQFCEKNDIGLVDSESKKNSLEKLQLRWIKRELNRFSKYVNAADFSDVGLSHLQGIQHLVFFSSFIHENENYYEWYAKSESDIFNDNVFKSLSETDGYLAKDAKTSALSIGEQWDVKTSSVNRLT